jgi:hypothetical protein
MTVYVDDMHQKQMGQFGRMQMSHMMADTEDELHEMAARIFGRMQISHMMADTEDELHEMAARIGMERRWFQDTLSGPRYDLSLSKRALALAAGTVEITMREMAAFAWHRRKFGSACVPAVALEKMTCTIRARFAQTGESS